MAITLSKDEKEPLRSSSVEIEIATEERTWRKRRVILDLDP